MARPIVAVSSVVVGCLAFAVAARFFADAAAPAPRVPTASTAHGPRLPPAPAPVAPEVIRLPPQLIRASVPERPRVAAPPRPKRRPAPDMGWPCSPWRALGPVYSVHQGEKPRQRHVRSLCFGPRPRAQLSAR